MHTPAELEQKFWKALRSDMTMMLGVVGADEAHTRPMTAQLRDDDNSAIWFFTAKDNAIVRTIGSGARAAASFTAKGHDLFATVHGTLQVDNDRAMIDALWNTFVAAWYEGGKDDPKLALVRLDPDRGQIWLNGSSLVAGVKMLLGADPKKDYQDKVAKVDLR